MGEYFGEVLAVASVLTLSGLAFGGVCRDGAVRFAFATLLLYVTLTPAVALLKGSDFPSFDFSSDVIEGAEEDYINVAEGALAKGIRDYICAEMKLDHGLVRVSLKEFDYVSMSARTVTVTLSGAATLADSLRIEQLVNGLEVGRCEVKIEIG